MAAAGWSPDDTRIMTAGDDGWLRVWDATNGELLQEIPTQGAVMGAYWVSNNTILTWTNNGVVRLWELETIATLASYDDPENGIIYGARAADFLTAWGESGIFYRWDSQHHTSETIQLDAPILYARQTAEEILLFTAPGIAYLYDAATLEPLRGLNFGDGTIGIDYNPDNQRVLTWGREGAAVIWDISDGQRLVLRSLSHSRTFVNGAMWSANGDKVLSWGADETVRLWDAETGTELFRASHEDWVTGARLNADETRLLSWAFTQLFLWDIASGDNLLTVQHNSLISGAAFNADESAVLTWGWDGTARITLVGR